MDRIRYRSESGLAPNHDPENRAILTESVTMLCRANRSQIIFVALVGAGVFLMACVFALTMPEVPTTVHQELVKGFEKGGGGEVVSAPAPVVISTPASALRYLAAGLQIGKSSERGPVSTVIWAPAHARPPPVFPHRSI